MGKQHSKAQINIKAPLICCTAQAGHNMKWATEKESLKKYFTKKLSSLQASCKPLPSFKHKLPVKLKSGAPGKQCVVDQLLWQFSWPLTRYSIGNRLAIVCLIRRITFPYCFFSVFQHTDKFWCWKFDIELFDLHAFIILLKKSLSLAFFHRHFHWPFFWGLDNFERHLNSQHRRKSFWI